MKNKHGMFVPVSDLVKSAASRIEYAFHRRSSVPCRYGFHALDEMTGGIHPADRVAVIAEDPDLATALIISVVHSLVVGDGGAARLVSVRHDETCVLEKLLSIESGITVIELRSGTLKPRDFSALTDAAGALHAAPLSIASIDALSVEDFIQATTISETVRHDAQETQVACEPLFIDGLPACLESDDIVLREIHDISKAEECPVVASVDTFLERWEECRCDRWFDVVLRVERSEINHEHHNGHTESVEIQVVKNRHGTVGTVYLVYAPSHSLIRDIEAE